MLVAERPSQNESKSVCHGGNFGRVMVLLAASLEHVITCACMHELERKQKRACARKSKRANAQCTRDQESVQQVAPLVAACAWDVLAGSTSRPARSVCIA